MKKTKLKEMKETLSDDFDRIKSKIHTTDNRFTEPRVQEFWRRAQKANFSEKELLSLEEELTHFQRKIEKHDWIRNQVDDVEADVKEGKSFDANTHEDLRQRQNDLHRKIKKLDSHFEEWIGTRDQSDL